MNDHHLILGQLVDFITGRTIDDTHDERYRQKIARLLVEQKGFAKERIRPNHPLTVKASTKSACVPITYIIEVAGHMAMLVQYGPGSLVTRHRPALALARLAAPYQIPVVVVTNGEAADLLEGATGRILGSGWEAIPSREQLTRRLQGYTWESLPARRVEMEARIVMAYEVDDRCPCDSTVCVVDER
ncbi:MAG: type I restriction enzyme HsdR N-terminal domain-containing protein [Desulfatitalea sp.]|nr:type I restriction enzyme HsdR N-terminal domain-containing protein [Desulfatitalea sp.]